MQENVESLSNVVGTGIRDIWWQRWDPDRQKYSDIPRWLILLWMTTRTGRRYKHSTGMEYLEEMMRTLVEDRRRREEEIEAERARREEEIARREVEVAWQMKSMREYYGVANALGEGVTGSSGIIGKQSEYKASRANREG